MEKGSAHQQNLFFICLLLGSKHAAGLQWCQVDLANPNTEPVLGDQEDQEATALFVSDSCIFRDSSLLFFCL